jgi:hypothetical protein
MASRSRVVELLETLASGKITVFEFIRLAKDFSAGDLVQLQNILRSFGAG